MLRHLVLSAAVSFTLIGCSQSTQELGGSPSPDLSQGDNDFFKTLAISNMTEINTSQMALQQSQNSQVREFAQHMITDHTEAQSKLATAAATCRVQLPSRIDDTHQAMADRLKDKSGSDFDKAYVDLQVKAHRETITADQNEADNGSDPKTKALANDLLGTLKMHLSMAEKLQSNM